MEMTRSRNAQQAIPAMLQSLFTAGELDDDGNLVLDYPVVYTFEEPRERLIFWPGIRRNPAQEVSQALHSLQPAEEKLGDSAQAVLSGGPGFLFSTPFMVVQAKLRGNKLDLHGILADSNPFTGAFGQLGLQLSILIEILAHAAKKQVGELTLQHQTLKLPKDVVSQLLKPAMQDIPKDPYRKMKPRKIDYPIGIKLLLDNPTETMGGSKWNRHVGGPLLLAGRAETPAIGRDLAKKIKADDFKLSMIEWCEAVEQAEAFKAQQAANGEA